MQTAICGALVAAAATPALAALPVPWSNRDIGAVGSLGAANGSGGSFAIAGAGADIGGTTDAFHYLYQRLNGNTQIVARVDTVQNTHPSARAGVMIRQDLTANSPQALVAITPGSGAVFISRSTTGGSSTTSSASGVTAPRWLKLARSGDSFAAFQSSNGTTWTQIGSTRTISMAAVIYVGLAVTSHVAGTNNNSFFSNVQLQAPPALFVVGSTSLNAGDTMVKRRLENLGYAVTVKAAPSATSGDANGKDIVVVSSTVFGADVNTKFRNVAVPVITWESEIFDDLGMTGTTANVDFGTTSGQTSASIYSSACDRATMYTAAKNFADGCHDLAAGLSGTVPLYKQGGALTWGKPGSSAVKIASLPSDSNRAVVFAYDKASTMVGGLTAPARRVALFLDSTSASFVTGRGLALFDRAVYWATGSRYSITKSVLALIYDPILQNQGNVRLSAYGQARWGFWAGDPVALLYGYLADITEATGGYVRWKLAENTGPRIFDRWGPTTASVQFDSPQFTEQNFIDAYNIGPTTGDWGAAGAAMPDGAQYGLDYNRVLDDNGVDAKVASGAVDEVVYYSHPFGGYSESAMAGMTPYPVNGPALFRSAPNYMVMGLNYERGLSEALESFGHRAEWLMDRHTFQIDATASYNPCFWALASYPPECGGGRQPAPTRNIYDFFAYVEGIAPGEAALGGAHWAPNASIFTQHEYVWDLPAFVWSHAPDWLYNYPRLLGTKEQVNAGTWVPMAQNGDYGRGWKKFWFQHMPRVPGLYRDAANANNDGKLNNWWEYIINFNRHPETQQ